MSSVDPVDPGLAPLVGSRICHDLASPVGAALTGLDFLEEMGAAGGETALLRDSLSGARATLDVLRLAFGRQGTGEAFDPGALGALLRGHLVTRPRLQLDWGLDGPPVPRPEAQRIALAVLCAMHALPRGGTIDVARAPGGAIRLAATGRLAADPALWDGLAGREPLPDPDPRRIEFHLLAAHLCRDGARIAITQDCETLTLAIEAPRDD